MRCKTGNKPVDKAFSIMSLLLGNAWKSSVLQLIPPNDALDAARGSL